jgi:hypothetical protein
MDVLTVNEALLEPAGMNTVPGTLAAPLLLERGTCAPPVGAGPLSVTTAAHGREARHALERLYARGRGRPGIPYCSTTHPVNAQRELGSFKPMSPLQEVADSLLPGSIFEATYRRIGYARGTSESQSGGSCKGCSGNYGNVGNPRMRSS